MRASAPYRLWCSAFTLSAIAHLWLPDAAQPGWEVPNVLLGVGACWCGFRRRFAPLERIGWAIAALGIAIPLLFLNDALSQSVYLLLVALSAALLRPEDHLKSVRLLTVGMYGAAAFHKLNRDFLDPDVSCASGGITLLGDNYGIDLHAFAEALPWPVLFLLAELGVFTLFLLRPRAAMGLAALMHLPLTIIFAPAFAWVMVPGWIAFLREEELEDWRRFLGRHYKVLVSVGGGLGVLSTTLYFRVHEDTYPAWQFAEFALWMLVVMLVPWAWFGSTIPESSTRRGNGVGRAPWFFLALFVANALSPYSGLQFHHAGAMLSNLRIDEGCWNHLVVPESLRVVEPYVRVNDVRIVGEQDAFDARVRGEDRAPASTSIVDEVALRARLFDPRGLHDAMRERCTTLEQLHAGGAPRLGLGLTIRYQGMEIDVADACEALPIPSGRPGAYQTNLERACPQACVH